MEWLAAVEFQYNDKSNRKDTIQVKLWKTLMEEEPCGTNRVSKIRRIPHRTTEEPEADHKIDRRSSKEHEETIWQGEKKSSRTESWKQHVVGK